MARLIEPFEPEIKGLERRCSAFWPRNGRFHLKIEPMWVNSSRVVAFSVEVTDAEVQSLALWQHGATEKFEAQAAKLLQQKSEHQKLLAEVDARGPRLHFLLENTFVF